MSHITIDKNRIYQEMTLHLQEEIQKLHASYEQARNTSIESPGRMQSRYDTMGIESAWVADGLAKQVKEKADELIALKELTLPDNPSKVELGAIIGVGPVEGDVTALYFLLPACGGTAIHLEGTSLSLRVVTPRTPVARELRGKSIGEEVVLRKDQEQPDVILVLL